MFLAVMICLFPLNVLSLFLYFLCFFCFCVFFLVFLFWSGSFGCPGCFGVWDVLVSRVFCCLDVFFVFESVFPSGLVWCVLFPGCFVSGVFVFPLFLFVRFFFSFSLRT